MHVKSRPLTRRVRGRPRPGRRRGFGRMQRKSAQEALGAAFVTLTLRRGIEITLFTMTMLEKYRRMDYVIYYDYTRKRMDYVLQHSSIKQLSTLLRSSWILFLPGVSFFLCFGVFVALLFTYCLPLWCLVCTFTNHAVCCGRNGCLVNGSSDVLAPVSYLIADVTQECRDFLGKLITCGRQVADDISKFIAQNFIIDIMQ